MPSFQYEGIDATGADASGTIDADTGAEAERRLRAMGLIRVDRLEDLAANDGGPALRGADVVELSEQVAILTANQIPLPEGLRALAEEVGSSRLRRMLEATAGRMERGEGLSDVLRSADASVPVHLARILDEGLRTGTVGNVLAEYVRHRNLASELNRRCLVALLYPLSMLALLLVLLGFVSTTLAPAFDEILGTIANRSISTGDGVSSVIAVNHFLAGNGVSVVAGILITLAFAWVFLRFTVGAATRRRILMRTPIIGPLQRHCSLAEFCNAMAMLVDASCPFPRAIELAADATGDAELIEAGRDVRVEVEAGLSLAQSPRAIAGLTFPLVQWIDWALRNNRLAYCLRVAARIYESRARSQTLYATYVFTTAVGVLAIWGTLFVMACVVYPLTLMLRLLF